MQIIGMTTQQEFWAASRERRFKINEMLVVEDSFQQNLVGQVVETCSYNKDLIFLLKRESEDSTVRKFLEEQVFKNNETIHVARVRLVSEASYPVEIEAVVRPANINEVQKYLLPNNPHKGLVMGIIKSTEDMYKGLASDLKDIVYIYSEGKLEKQKQVPFIFDIHAMYKYPHIGIFGDSGSGKSYAVRIFLEEIIQKRIPAVIFDPCYEMDFNILSAQGNENNIFLSSSKILKIGYNVGISFSNLTTSDLKNLLFPSGSTTDTNNIAIDILHKKKDTFDSFNNRLEFLCEGLEIGKPKIQEMIAATRNTYERERFENIISVINEYSDQVSLMSVKEIAGRLTRLQNDGIFNSDITPVEEGLKKGKVVVIQGSIRLLQVFAGYLLSNLYKKRRAYKDFKMKKTTSDYFPPFLIIMDEAHAFAPNNHDMVTKLIMRDIAQESRKYGVFLLLATQRPSLLDETITTQLNSKFIFRTVNDSDIALIREETDLSAEESKRLPHLCSGDAFFSSAIIGRTINIRIRDAFTENPHIKDPFDELLEVSHANEQEFLNIILPKLPIGEGTLAKVIEEIHKEKGILFEQNEFLRNLDMLAANKKIEKRQTQFGCIYDKI